MAECVVDHAERVEALHGLLVCKHHRRRIDDNAREIQALILDTMWIRDGGAPADASPRGGKMPKKRADPPAPGDTTIIAMYDPRTATTRIPTDHSEPVPNVLAIVASWLMYVADERPLSSQLPKSVLGQLDLLVRHHEWLAAQDCIDDYHRELHELRTGLRHAVNDRAAERIGTCDLPLNDGHACGGSLLIDNGSSVIRCASCKANWTTPAEQARLAVRLN